MGEEIFMGRYSWLEEEEERKERSGRIRSMYTRTVRLTTGFDSIGSEWLTGWTQKIRSVERDAARTEIRTRRRNCSESRHGVNTL
jgi:hypothetical protein